MASNTLIRTGNPALAINQAAGLPAHGLAERSASQLSQPDFLAQWAQLAQRAAEPNPFYESWYLLPSLKALGQRRSICVLCYFEQGQLAGLIPVQRSLTYYGKPVPNISGWAHPNCFLGTPLVAKGREEAFWSALLDYADSHTGTALFLHLPRISADGPLANALRNVTAQRSRLYGIVQDQKRAMLISDLSPDEYFAASMSAKKRKELRRQHKRLSEEGVLEFSRQTGTEALAEWVESFLSLEQRGWKGEKGSALSCDPATRYLFHEALRGAADHGKLERLSLTLNGLPIAMLANFITAPGAFSYKTAYDERYSRFSPGVLIQRENLDLLQHKHIGWVDSCAAEGHPMIERIWREKRHIVCVSIAIGGSLRQTLFKHLLRKESRGTPRGL